MNTVKKSLSLSLLVLLGLAGICDAKADTTRNQKYIQKHVDACLSEIRQRGDFQNASRVVHWVQKLDQRNVVELELEIDTAVYEKSATPAKYSASCVTNARAVVIEFRMAPAVLADQAG